VISTVFILGAGFSKCADLPVQSEFSSLLLSNEFSSGLDPAITRILTQFLMDVFGWRSGATFPLLEDVFTCIDLSAATGHHLGIKYTPKALRAIRRMAIHRIFSVLDRRFHYSGDISSVLSSELHGARAFLVLNWDIVLEKHLQRFDPTVRIDYCCDCTDWNRETGLGFVGGAGENTNGLEICKLHGSSNWVYCENCKSLFYDLNEKLSLRTKVGLIKADFRLFDETFKGKYFEQSLGIDASERKCRHCNNMVSSHIATFSYRKSFRTHAYPSIWHRAENLLATADRWVFVGYSLPKADFELKHLLKSAQLRFAHRRPRPELAIDVVVKGEASRRDYEAFFGTGRFHYFDGGLEEYALRLARDADVTRSSARGLT
jgi:hypothetical protein